VPLTEVDPSECKSIVVTGDQLTQLGADDLDRVLRFQEIVFARTTPHQKLDIVEGLQVSLKNTISYLQSTLHRSITIIFFGQYLFFLK
jgi:magnesium-transporting ATPase (P-type)